jgi:competence protein ComEC
MPDRHALTLIALATLLGVGWLHTQALLPSAGQRLAAFALAVSLLVAIRPVLGRHSARDSARDSGRQRLQAPAIALGALAIALLAWTGAAWRADAALASRLPETLEGIDLQVSGIVRGLPQPGRYGVRFEFAVHDCQPACPGLRQLSLNMAHGVLRAADAAIDPPGPAPEGDQSGPGLLPGESWTLLVRLKRPHALVNPGAFDRELRWLQEGIDGVGQVRRILRAPSAPSDGPESQAIGGREPRASVWPASQATPGTAPWVLIERWRAQLRDAMVYTMSRAGDRRWQADRRASEGTLLALAVGDQAAIDPADWRIFNRTGIGHLMSISGLHITVLAAAAGAMAARAWRTPWACRRGLPLHWPMQRVRWVVAMLAALFYALLSGWGIPAQRTAFMLLVAAVLMLSGRGQSMMVVLSAALIIVLILDPWAVLTPGFWLSFGAVGVLVWAGQGASLQSAGRWQALRGAVHTQWAATLAMLPLGILFFGNVSLVGPLANALAIPVVTVVLTPAALIGSVLAALHPPLGACVLTPALWITDGLLLAITTLSEASWAVAVVPQPPAGVIVVAGLGMVLLLAPRGLVHRAAGVLALLPLAWIPADRPPGAHWRLTALDVGQGSALVLQGARHTLLFDTGPGQSVGQDAGERIVVPWLQRAGLSRLDELVVSHLDLDHSGGLQSVLKHMEVPSVRASFRPSQARMPAQADAPLAAERSWKHCARHDAWTHAGVRFTVLHPRDPPEPVRGSSSNALSCVLRVDGPGWRILFTGDIEAAQERRLLEAFPAEALRSDLLVVPHHGSITSSTEGFLDAVRPSHAIVQSAYRSRYRHPHPTVLSRYVARGIKVWRTDAHGAITVELAPHAPPRILTARQSPARYWRVPVRETAPSSATRVSLGGPASVHGPGSAPDLIGGGRAQEDRERPELFGRDEFP